MKGHVLALSGGVGGAKLVAGLAKILEPENLTVVVNTGDDFEHLGLTICPDIDSVVYSIAGLNDLERGWGMAGESWQAMKSLQALGEEDWFNLGDRDLGMHLARSWRLRAGETLSNVTSRLTRAVGIQHLIAPMSDAPVRTQLVTEAGTLDFQRYFVRERCKPIVSNICFEGASGAPPSPALDAALQSPDLRLVIICPSNPYLSVDPILAIESVRARLKALSVPIVIVSPLVGRRALKGPLAKLMTELGYDVSNLTIARHYAGLADHIVIDYADEDDAEFLEGLGFSVTTTATVMRNPQDQEQLACVTLSIRCNL